mgnify:CR=1 FL=1
MYNRVKYVLKLEKYVGGVKMKEKILNEFMSEDILGMLNDCENSREIISESPSYEDEQNKNIEDSIYYGPTYATNI